MSRYVFRLPDVGEGTAEATIASWRVAVGEQIEEDAPLVELETDKAIVEIPAPVSGTILSLNGKVGERVAVGSELVVIETAAPGGARVDVGSAAAVAETTPAQGESDGSSAEAPRQQPSASPAVRKRARELGIDLGAVQGSGPSGRVTSEDLESYSAAYTTRSKTAHKLSDVGPSGSEDHPLSAVRRRIAERMQEAKRRVPHFSYVEEIDVTSLEELRARLNSAYSGSRARLTPIAFLMRALLQALSRHPDINARFNDDKGVVHRYYDVHCGIATQTPAGLMVPVVRDLKSRDLWDCAAEVLRLSSAARAGSATREELSGSTITITSLGNLGGIASTPIINYPEVAIIGMNRIIERPVVRSGGIVVRKMMNLSSSFDHRVVDGWHAASFIHDVKQLLEEPATLFIQ